MKRTHYANGDTITLSCGCDGCNPTRINGTLCHESGCQESWRDHSRECRECGCDFPPTDRYQNTCDDCANPPEQEQETQSTYRRVMVGRVYTLVMPFSELCMAARIAGKAERVYIRPNGAYQRGGAGPHMNYGEAGIMRRGNELWADVVGD